LSLTDNPRGRRTKRLEQLFVPGFGQAATRVVERAILAVARSVIAAKPSDAAGSFDHLASSAYEYEI
jgi:hypothetical protein